ncbi:MAG: YceI family protein, partial [Planctomycetota bacterium]
SAGPDLYEVDPGHSSVFFKVKHFDVSNFYGRFNEVSGQIQYAEEKPAESSVKITIPVASIDTNSKGRDEHLLGPDYFDVENHKEWIFESTEVMGSDKGWQVKGNLTLRDVTREITLDLEKVGMGDTRFGPRAGWETTFTIDRNDYGISGNAGLLGDEVTITVSLEAIKKS